MAYARSWKGDRYGSGRSCWSPIGWAIVMRSSLIGDARTTVGYYSMLQNVSWTCSYLIVQSWWWQVVGINLKSFHRLIEDERILTYTMQSKYGAFERDAKLGDWFSVNMLVRLQRLDMRLNTHRENHTGSLYAFRIGIRLLLMLYRCTFNRPRYTACINSSTIFCY